MMKPKSKLLKTASVALLSILLAAGISGCGTSSTAGVQNADIPSASGVSTIHLSSSNFYDSKYDDEMNHSIYSMNYITVNVSENEEYPALQSALEDLGTVISDEADYWRESSLSDLEYTKESLYESDMQYTRDQNVFVQRADTRAVSLLYATDEFNLGAHGYYYFKGYNIDSETGQFLELSDVVTDMPAFVDLVSEAMAKRYSDVEFFTDPKEYMEELTGDGMLDSLVWSLGYDGICIYFNTYELASYADGCQIVEIPFSSCSGIINEKYLEIPESYIIGFDPYAGLLYDFNGDGSPESLCVSGAYNEWEYIDTVSISLGTPGSEETSIEDDIYCYEYFTNFVHTADADYLYLTGTSENDYKLIHVYEIANGKIKNNGYENLYNQSRYNDFNESSVEEMMTDPDNLRLSIRTDILGTTFIDADFGIGKDGIPVSKTGYYIFDTANEYSHLVLSQNLEVEITSDDLNDDGSPVKQDGAGEKVTLSAGEEVIKSRSDGETWVDVIIEGGNMARIYVDMSDWPNTINGVDVEEIFENIMYAG